MKHCKADEELHCGHSLRADWDDAIRRLRKGSQAASSVFAQLTPGRRGLRDHRYFNTEMIHLGGYGPFFLVEAKT